MPDIYFDVDTALGEVPVNLMPLIDDTDFKTRETAVAYNASGMDLVWNFVTSAGAFTQTAVTPTSGGTYDWTHQGDAIYTIEIPASGGASINNDTEGFGWFTGVATGVLPWRGPVIGFRAAALNDALIDGGDNLDVNVVQFGGTNATSSGGRPEVNTSHAAGTAWGSGAITSAAIASSALNGKGDWNVGKTGYALSSAGVQAIWDALTSALTTVGSIGKLLVDNINATISSRLAGASYTAPLDAAGTRAAVGLASANLDTQLAALQTDVDDLKSGIIYGSAATGTLSTTQATSNLSGYGDDQLIGRVIIWLTGNCEGEATDITDYASASGLLTFTALTTAPGNGDTFKIV